MLLVGGDNGVLCDVKDCVMGWDLGAGLVLLSAAGI